MSLSSLLMVLASGNRDRVGLPIFTSRRFFHTGAWVRVASGIITPRVVPLDEVFAPSTLDL